MLCPILCCLAFSHVWLSFSPSHIFLSQTRLDMKSDIASNVLKTMLNQNYLLSPSRNTKVRIKSKYVLTDSRRDYSISHFITSLYAYTNSSNFLMDIFGTEVQYGVSITRKVSSTGCDPKPQVKVTLKQANSVNYGPPPESCPDQCTKHKIQSNQSIKKEELSEEELSEDKVSKKKKKIKNKKKIKKSKYEKKKIKEKNHSRNKNKINVWKKNQSMKKGKVWKKNKIKSQYKKKSKYEKKKEKRSKYKRKKSKYEKKISFKNIINSKTPKGPMIFERPRSCPEQCTHQRWFKSVELCWSYWSEPPKMVKNEQCRWPLTLKARSHMADFQSWPRSCPGQCTNQLLFKSVELCWLLVVNPQNGEKWTMSVTFHPEGKVTHGWFSNLA